MYNILLASLVVRCAGVAEPSEWRQCQDETPALPDAWTNSLGMEFVSVPGTRVLFCAWLTRNQDYRAFATVTGTPWSLDLKNLSNFPQGPSHPAVNMSYFEARMFCEWLTKREQQAGQLDPNFRYRLPTEQEWTVAASTGASAPGGSGAPTEYPWGNQWPPPWGFANYATKLLVDSYPYTSPVGAFPANGFGLYDISGNVHQWCEYDDQSTVRARTQINAPILGGGFAPNATTSEKVTLSCSFRSSSSTQKGQMGLGFRLVMGRNSP
jgi:formylglycine-generating enzyme required for sulfatase activity